MSLETVKVSFIGHKISKVCWSLNRDESLNTNEFITGSWDDKINYISKWRISDDAIEESTNAEPFLISQYSLVGSITDMIYLDYEKIVYSTSNGDVGVITTSDMLDEMNQVQYWEKLHRYDSNNESSACCSVAVNDLNVVTGGEDGRINYLHLDSKKPIKVIENADNSNITELKFLGSKEFASINTTGQLKIWDSQNLKSAVKTLTLSGNACPLLSLDRHPNQPHIIVTGHGDGVIGIWDIRMDKAPVTLIDAHAAEVWKVQFHPLYPDNLFTCSEDGSCWFWNGASMISGASMIKSLNDTMNQVKTTSNPSSSIWLYVDANKHKMETFSLIPFNKSAINTFDIYGSSLICGTDGEALIVVNDIPVR